MLVNLRDGSSQTIVRSATLRQKLQIKLSISPSHSTLTLSQPVTALTLQAQAPGRVTTGVPILKSLAGLDPEKFSRCKRESNPGSAAFEADPLTTRPKRRSAEQWGRGVGWGGGGFETNVGTGWTATMKRLSRDAIERTWTLLRSTMQIERQLTPKDSGHPVVKIPSLTNPADSPSDTWMSSDGD